MNENLIGGLVITASIQIHRELGPGLLESVYETVMWQHLTDIGLEVERQVAIGIEYRGKQLADAFRADLMVEKKVLIELKCVQKLTDIHKKQLLTYLRLSKRRLGYLLNFNELLMKNGIVRIANGLS